MTHFQDGCAVLAFISSCLNCLKPDHRSVSGILSREVTGNDGDRDAAKV